MTVTIVRGDARHLPLPDNSVDLICTSPPYYGLRDYRDGDQSLAGQIGAEPTPREYLEALWKCTREWMRVLKPAGSLWINLGDKYSQRAGQFGPQGQTGQRATRAQAATYVDVPARRDLNYGIAAKSLIGLPWRYALGCIDDLGLILRAEVIWDKPNGLPESVTDRVRRSHEHWFHFTSRPHYYSAVDEIREPHKDISVRRAMPHRAHPGRRDGEVYGLEHGQTLRLDQMNHPLGALPGSVWEIAAQPLKVPDHLGVDHFAAFPMEFPRRIIRGWSPSAICAACGEGRRPLTARAVVDGHDWAQSQQFDRIGQSTPNRRAPSALGYRAEERATRITGYACACPAPDATSRPAVVLDPFGGTGTTALIADLYGRHGISVDRSADYCRIAQWRTTDPGERARGLEQPKPKPTPREREDQDPLFGDEVSA